MASKVRLSQETVDGLLKALSVLSRAVDEILESGAANGAPELQIANLSRSKAQMLRLLEQQGGQTATQAARFLGVTKPAVTQLINGMVRSKLVDRSPSRRDRREVRLKLAKGGRNVLQLLRRKQHHLLRNAIRMTTGADPDRWSAVLFEVAGALTRSDRAYERLCLQCGAYADESCILVGGDAECLFRRHAGGNRARVRKTKTARKR